MRGVDSEGHLIKVWYLDEEKRAAARQEERSYTATAPLFSSFLWEVDWNELSKTTRVSAYQSVSWSVGRREDKDANPTRKQSLCHRKSRGEKSWVGSGGSE